MKINNPIKAYENSDSYKIRRYAKILVKNGIYESLTAATIESKRYYDGEKEGLIEPLKYPLDDSLFQLEYKFTK